MPVGRRSVVTIFVQCPRKRDLSHTNTSILRNFLDPMASITRNISNKEKNRKQNQRPNGSRRVEPANLFTISQLDSSLAYIGMILEKEVRY